MYEKAVRFHKMQGGDGNVPADIPTIKALAKGLDDNNRLAALARGDVPEAAAAPNQIAPEPPVSEAEPPPPDPEVVRQAVAESLKADPTIGQMLQQHETFKQQRAAVAADIRKAAEAYNDRAQKILEATWRLNQAKGDEFAEKPIKDDLLALRMEQIEIGNYGTRLEQQQARLDQQHAQLRANYEARVGEHSDYKAREIATAKAEEHYSKQMDIAWRVELPAVLKANGLDLSYDRFSRMVWAEAQLIPIEQQRDTVNPHSLKAFADRVAKQFIRDAGTLKVQLHREQSGVFGAQAHARAAVTAPVSSGTPGAKPQTKYASLDEVRSQAIQRGLALVARTGR